MRKRLLAMLAVMALGLVPAVAAAVDAPPAGSSTIMVKAWSEVTAVSPTTVELDVIEAQDWVDGVYDYAPSTGINGQHIVVGVTPETVVYKNGAVTELADLKPGMKVKAYMSTDVRPVTTANVFTATKLAFEVPKPHPGLKFERAFFPRLWQTHGVVLGLGRHNDVNVMNMDVRNITNTPKRFRDERWRVLRLDAYVMVPANVVITDKNNKRISFEQIPVDARVKVTGKFLRAAKWIKDETGEPTPTLLARRIKVKVAVEGDARAVEVPK